MESEKLSQEYWEQVPHLELPDYASDKKTAGDLIALTQLLSLSDYILDLGCGWGRITSALTLSGYHVVGVDLSENLITYARRLASTSGLKIQFELGSLVNIPFPDDAFDKVICVWGVFNHLLTRADQVKALNEMYRVLKPGGLGFIEMGNGERKKYREIREMIGYGPDKRICNFQYKEGAPPNVLYVHDRQALRQRVEESLFERYRVRFQNINRKRRIVAYLLKSEDE